MWACGPTIVKVVLSFANVSSNCQKGMGQFGGVSRWRLVGMVQSTRELCCVSAVNMSGDNIDEEILTFPAFPPLLRP